MLQRSAAIERARRALGARNSNQMSAYFYCSFSNQETQDIRKVVASLIQQLCDSYPPLWKDVHQQYLTYRGQLDRPADKMPLEEGLTLLNDQCARFGPYLFIDAINESKQSKELLSMIQTLVVDAPSVRIMVSSTEELGDHFTSKQATIIPMERKSVRRDIQTYIQNYIQCDLFLGLLPNGLKNEIIATLQRDSDEM